MCLRAYEIKFIIGFLLIAFLVTGSLAAEEKTSKAAQNAEIIVSGSTVLQPLAEIWASEFNRLQQDYHVSVHGGGPKTGITDIVGNRSDIGMVSRKINSEDRKYETDLKKFQIFPVGHDAVCIVVSKNVYDAGVRSLTKEQVKLIYEGKIRNWQEVGGPDHEIFLMGREPGSGTKDVFDNFIFGTNLSIPKNVSISYAYTTEAIIANLDLKGSGIGYVGYIYSNRGNVIALNGILPTLDTIRDETYPMVRDLYFWTFGKPGSGASAFIKFVIGQKGQNVAAENGYVTLENKTSSGVQMIKNGADLSNMNLSHLNMAGASLTRSDLQNSTLEFANLSRSSLDGAIVNNARLRGANLSQASMEDADLMGCDLSHADLRYADLVGSDLTGSNLTGADLTGADLQQARLAETDFAGAKLDYANLTATNLSHSDLRGASLVGAYLRRT